MKRKIEEEIKIESKNCKNQKLAKENKQKEEKEDKLLCTSSKQPTDWISLLKIAEDDSSGRGGVVSANTSIFPSGGEGGRLISPVLSQFLVDPEWNNVLENEFKAPYWAKLEEQIFAQVRKGKEIYPAPHLVFHALNLTPLSKVRVVILGQDPYIGPGQACGLCFSVRPDVPSEKFPPSLTNIFKELETDLSLSPSLFLCLRLEI